MHAVTSLAATSSERGEDQVKPGKADLVKEFTFDYPSQIIAGLLGLPEEDYPQFQRWSISLLSWILNPERGLAASAALCDYFARSSHPAAPNPRTI